MSRTTKGGYPSGSKSAADLKRLPASLIRAAVDDHDLTFGNYRGHPDLISGDPGAADQPERRPRLLGPDGQPVHPDPPFDFTPTPL